MANPSIPESDEAFRDRLHSQGYFNWAEQQPTMVDPNSGERVPNPTYPKFQAYQQQSRTPPVSTSVAPRSAAPAAPAAPAAGGDPYDSGLRAFTESADESMSPGARAALAQASKPGVIPGGFQSGLYSSLSGAARTFGFDSTAKALQEEAHKVAPVLDYRKAAKGGLRGWALYGSGQLASGVGSMIPIAGAAVAGTVAGSPLGPAGMAAGGYTGAMGAAFATEAGETINEAVEQGLDPNDPKVRAEAHKKGLINMGLEALVPGVGSAAVRIGRRVTTDVAKDVAGRAGMGVAGRAAVGGGAGLLGEASTEGLQTVSELEAMARITGKPVDYNDPEVRAKLVNAILGGAIVGTAIGGGVGAASRRGRAGPGGAPRPSRGTPATPGEFEQRAEDGTLPRAAPPGEFYQPGPGEPGPPSAPVGSPGEPPGGAPPPPSAATLGEHVGVVARGAFDQFMGAMGRMRGEQARAATTAMEQEHPVEAMFDRPSTTELRQPAPADTAAQASEVVSQVGDLRDGLVQGWREGTVSSNEVAETLDAGLAAAIETAPSEAKPAVVAQALIGDGPFTAKEPGAQGDIFLKHPADVANFLNGGTHVPGSVPPGGEAKYMKDHEESIDATRTETARLGYDALHPVTKGQLSAQFKGDLSWQNEALQVAVSDALQEQETQAGLQKIRGAGASSIRKGNQKRRKKKNPNRQYTQNEYAIRDSLMEAIFDREQRSLDASGLNGERLIHALAKAKARASAKANEYTAAMRAVFEERGVVEEGDTGLITERGVGQEKVTAPAGKTQVPDDEMIYLYTELLADVLNTATAQGIFNQAKQLYQSNIDLDLLETFADNGTNIVYQYTNSIDPRHGISKSQAKRIFSAIQAGLIGIGPGLSTIRQGFMAKFGGSPNTFEALVRRIDNLNKGVTLTAQVKESAEGPSFEMRFDPTGRGATREPAGYGERLSPDEGDLTAQEAVEAEREAESLQELPDVGFGAQEESFLPEFRIGSKEALIPASDEKRVQAVLEGIRSGAFGDVTVRALTIDEATQTIHDQIRTGQVAMDPQEVSDYVLSTLIDTLKGSTSATAAAQRVELEAARSSVAGFDEVASKYKIFMMDPRAERIEGLPQSTVERIANRVADKGSAEQGTISLMVPWRGGKPARREYSAVKLSIDMLGLPQRVVGQEEAAVDFPVKLARVFSRGLGALVQSVKADSLFAQVPKPATATAKMPKDMAQTAGMVGTKSQAGERIGLATLLSPPYQDQVLDWLSGVIPRDQYSRRIPDANVALGTSGYTMQVSGSMLQVIDKKGEVVAGPALRNDLLVYRTGDGRSYTVGDLAEATAKWDREQIAADLDYDELHNKDIRKSIDKALSPFGNPKTLWNAGLKLSPAERDDLPYAAELKYHENWARKSESWTGWGQDEFHYVGPTKWVGDKEVAIGDPAMHETRLAVDEITPYETEEEAAPAPGEKVSAEMVGTTARPIEQPRVRTRKKADADKIDQLLGFDTRTGPREAMTEPVKVGSMKPSDWPSDVRERVERWLEPLYRAEVKALAIGPPQPKPGLAAQTRRELEGRVDEKGRPIKVTRPGEKEVARPVAEPRDVFAERVLSDPGFEKNPAVRKARGVVDRYHAAVEAAQAKTGRTQVRTMVPASTVERIPEQETQVFARKQAEEAEAEPRGPTTEFNEPLYPTNKDIRRTANRVRGVLGRARAVNPEKGAVAVFDRVQKAVDAGVLNDAELRELGITIAQNAERGLPAISAKLDLLSQRAQARTRGRREGPESEAARAQRLEAIKKEPLKPDEWADLESFLKTEPYAGQGERKFEGPGPLTELTEDVLRTMAAPSATDRVIAAGQEFIRLRNRLNAGVKARPLTAEERRPSKQYPAGRVDPSLSAQERRDLVLGIRRAISAFRAEQISSEMVPARGREAAEEGVEQVAPGVSGRGAQAAAVEMKREARRGRRPGAGAPEISREEILVDEDPGEADAIMDEFAESGEQVWVDEGPSAADEITDRSEARTARMEREAGQREPKGPRGASPPVKKPAAASLTSQVASAAAEGADTILLPEGAKVTPPEGFTESIPGHLERRATPNVPRGTSAPISPAEFAQLAREDYERHKATYDALAAALDEPIAPSEVTIHSGGAKGSDTAFGRIGSELGLATVAHSFAGHRPEAGSGQQKIHSPAELAQADKLLNTINKKYLKRKFPPGSAYVANLLRRNYYQVRDSDAVIAVSNIGTDGIVEGGTGWAAYMGIELDKPTYVFDQGSRRWHKWEDGDWVKSGLPPPYRSFAGVGTRDLEGHGERAIRDYLTQFKSGAKSLQRKKAVEPPPFMKKLVEVMKGYGFKLSTQQQDAFMAVAAKHLIAPSVDPAAFIRQAADALSHLVMGLGGTQELKDLIATYATEARMKEIAKLRVAGATKGESLVESYRTVLARLLRGELGARGRNEANALAGPLAERIRNITELVLSGAYRAEPKPGQQRMSFEAAVEADPHSAEVLAALASHSRHLLATGSFTLGIHGPIYRQSAAALHDLDLILTDPTKYNAIVRDLKSQFPGTVDIYHFTVPGQEYSVHSFLVPPKGHTIGNVTRDPNNRLNGYEVHKDGKAVGTTKINTATGKETKTGVRATLADLFVYDNGKQVAAGGKYTFDLGGQKHTITTAAVGHTFGAKLRMGREKDIADYAQFVNETASDAAYNLQQPGAGHVPRGTMEAIANEIRKLLGPKVVAAWEARNFGGSGEWIANDRDAFAGIIRLAVSAADAMGVAHHEAMHALLTRLQTTPDGRRAIQMLVEATSQPHVVEQLHAALEGHPEAQGQLSDPMERVTYAYQFYRANPKGFRLAPKARNWFQNMVEWLREVTGFLTNTQRADRIFDAFSQGTFATPPLMAEFLQNQLDSAGRQRSWAESQKGPISQAIQKVLRTGDALMRDSGIPALVDIAERIQNRFGGSGGFLPERMRTSAQWENKLANAIEGHTEAELAEAQKNLSLKKPPSSPLERKIRDLYDEFYRYLSGAEVQQFAGMKDGKPTWKPIPYRKDYHHNLWVPEAIQANRAEFESMLASHGFENPDNIAENIISGMVAEDNMQGDFEKGYTPLFGGASARALDQVYDDPRSLQFRSQDLIETVHRYLWQGVHRAEHTRHFGHLGSAMRALAAEAAEQGATEAQVKAATQYIMAAEGTLGATIDPKLRKLFGAVTTYQNFRILPLALFSQLVDPIGIVIRGGTFRNAANAYMRGIKAAFKGVDESEMAELSKLLGIISARSSLETLGQTYGSIYMSKHLRNLNDKFFRIIGLTGWNNGVRVAATEAALSFFANQLANPGAHTERWLNDLGLQPGDLQMLQGGDRIRLFASEGLHIDQATRVQQAMNRWVNEAIVRPTAADRPIYGSDPRFGLIFYLKQFSYSFQKYILGRAMTEARHGNYAPAMALGSYVPIMIAADLARSLIQGAGEEPEWRKKWTVEDYVWNGIQRAGLLGTSQFSLDAVEDAKRGGLGVESWFGPTAAQGLQGLQVLAGNKELSNYLVNAMPGQVIYKGWF